MSAVAQLVDPRSAARAADEAAVVAALRRHRRGTSVLELARATELGAVVVVPVIRGLVAAGLAQRQMVPVVGHPSRSEYRLTSAGRRQAS